MGIAFEYPEIRLRRETTLPSLPAKTISNYELVKDVSDEEVVGVGVIKYERRESTVDPEFHPEG